MKTTRILIEPTLNMKREIPATGTAVRVVAGAHPSMRLYFRNPNEETYPGQFGQVVRNGSVLVPEDGATFNTIHLRCQTLQNGLGGVTAQERLVLEVIDCWTPVVVLNTNQGAGWRFHWIAGNADLTEHLATTAFSIYADNAWGANGTIDDQNTADYIPRGWIGGGVQADAPITVVALQHLTKNGTRKVEIARWTADTKTINDGTDWLYGVSFESDGAPLVDSAKTAPNQSGTGLIPWPLFGLSLSVRVGASDVNSLTWLLYSRGAMD